MGCEYSVFKTPRAGMILTCKYCTKIRNFLKTIVIFAVDFVSVRM